MALAIAAAFVVALPATAHAYVLGSYATDISVSQPTLLSPANSATLNFPSNPVQMTWTSVAGASKYQIQIAKIASIGDSCLFTSDTFAVNLYVNDRAYVPTMLDSQSKRLQVDTSYCWRVRAMGGGKPGQWSSTRKLTRAWASQPTNLRFYNDATTIPRPSESVASDTSTSLTGYVRWDAVPGAAAYDLQIGQSDSWAEGSIILTRDNMKGNAIALPHLPNSTSGGYVWRVRTRSADGTPGDWAYGSQFTVNWDTMIPDPGSVHPAHGTTQHEITMGWVPVTGASYYEVEAATRSGCLGTANTGQRLAYGSWIKADDPFTPRLIDCMLTEPSTTTVNTWITMEDVVGDTAINNINDDCWKTSECTRPDLLDGGSALASGGSMHWRVRPMAQITSGTETGWEVRGDSLVVRGGWLQRDNGAPFRYEFDPTITSPVSESTRCEDDDNPTGSPGSGCLVQKPTQLRVDGSSENSDSMHLPLFSWEPFVGNNGAPYAGGYLIQVASDPSFTTAETVLIDQSPYESHNGYYGFQTSWIPKTSLVDSKAGTGYWWRVIPCDYWPVTTLFTSFPPCAPLYYESLAGLYGVDSDNAGARTFTKAVSLTTTVDSNFSGSSPLLSWPAVDGSDHYEVRLARDLKMQQDAVTLKTSSTRMVPHEVSEEYAQGDADTGIGEIAEGTWYFQVRAVDRDGLQSGWSDVSSFVKRTPTPVIAGPVDGAVSSLPILSWAAVEGADTYEVQWSRDSGFTGVTTTTTQQTAVLLDAAPGVYYWRVRASSHGHTGLWTDGSRSVQVVDDASIRYKVSRTVVPANGNFTISGLFTENGSATNSRTIELHRKSTGCSSTGSYSKIASKTSGSAGDDGTVVFSLTADRTRCYRLVWSDAVASAPFEVQAQPKASHGFNKTTVVRNRTFYTTVKTNVPVTGRMRVQYRAGGKWNTIATKRVTAKRKQRMAAKVNRSGRFKTRVVLDKMPAYRSTTKGGPKIRVNDLWTFYYS